ncbi:hypothetical protein GCM10025880_22480 [Methylorubrum aminovorans]|nr:hypothetical protein GCM10025880_22480 [Methylorubrum aminovorans]
MGEIHRLVDMEAVGVAEGRTGTDAGGLIRSGLKQVAQGAQRVGRLAPGAAGIGMGRRRHHSRPVIARRTSRPAS